MSTYPKLVIYNNRDGIDSNIIEQLIELRNKANLFYHKFTVAARMGSQGSLCDWNSFFTHKGDRIYSFEIGKGYQRKIVACLNINIDDSYQFNSNRCVYVTNIWVEPEFRRSNLASMLVRKMFEDYKGSEFHISVYEGNTAAKKFWQSVGFVEKLYSSYVLKWEDNDEND